MYHTPPLRSTTQSFESLDRQKAHEWSLAANRSDTHLQRLEAEASHSRTSFCPNRQLLCTPHLSVCARGCVDYDQVWSSALKLGHSMSHGEYVCPTDTSLKVCCFVFRPVSHSVRLTLQRIRDISLQQGMPPAVLRQCWGAWLVACSKRPPGWENQRIHHTASKFCVTALHSATVFWRLLCAVLVILKSDAHGCYVYLFDSQCDLRSSMSNVKGWRSCPQHKYDCLWASEHAHCASRSCLTGRPHQQWQVFLRS